MMRKIIKVKEVLSKKDIYINTDSIIMFYKDIDFGSTIKIHSTSSESELHVFESPNEILKLMNKE